MAPPGRKKEGARQKRLIHVSRLFLVRSVGASSSLLLSELIAIEQQHDAGAAVLKLLPILINRPPDSNLS
jgi:hypothetical protein